MEKPREMSIAQWGEAILKNPLTGHFRYDAMFFVMLKLDELHNEVVTDPDSGVFTKYWYVVTKGVHALRTHPDDVYALEMFERVQCDTNAAQKTLERKSLTREHQERVEGLITECRNAAYDAAP